MDDYKNKLAKLFKQLENKSLIGPLVGTVIDPPPNISISILEGQVIIYPEHLYMSDKLYNDYTRKYKVEGNIDEMKRTLSKFDLTNTTATGLAGTGPHAHQITSLKGSTGSTESTGTLKTSGDFWFTDTLKKDDEVLLLPTVDEQTWFIIDKIRKVM